MGFMHSFRSVFSYLIVQGPKHTSQFQRSFVLGASPLADMSLLSFSPIPWAAFLAGTHWSIMVMLSSALPVFLSSLSFGVLPLITV